MIRLTLQGTANPQRASGKGKARSGEAARRGAAATGREGA